MNSVDCSLLLLLEIIGKGGALWIMDVSQGPVLKIEFAFRVRRHERFCESFSSMANTYCRFAMLLQKLLRSQTQFL